MPIFEYICQDCEAHSEILVYSGDEVSCPHCQSAHLVKQFSVFATGTGEMDSFRQTAEKMSKSTHTHHAGCGCGAPKPGACQN